MFILKILLLSSKLWASEPPQSIISYGHEETSDNLIMRSIRIHRNIHRRDLFWPYQEAVEQATDFGVDAGYNWGDSGSGNFVGSKVSWFFGHKFNNQIYVKGNLGMHTLDNKQRSHDHTIFQYELQGQYIFKKMLYLKANVGHDFLYEELALPKGLTDNLKTIKKSLFALFTYNSMLRATLRYRHDGISDGNSKFNYDIEAKYGISAYAPWFWVGAGFNQVGFDKDLAGYWTPKRATAYGPRAEFSSTIWDEISGSLALNASYFKEKGQADSGKSIYASGKIQYGNRNAWLTYLSLTRIQSEQKGSTWTSTKGELNFTYPF